MWCLGIVCLYSSSWTSVQVCMAIPTCTVYKLQTSMLEPLTESCGAILRPLLKQFYLAQQRQCTSITVCPLYPCSVSHKSPCFSGIDHHAVDINLPATSWFQVCWLSFLLVFWCVSLLCQMYTLLMSWIVCLVFRTLAHTGVRLYCYYWHYSQSLDENIMVWYKRHMCYFGRMKLKLRILKHQIQKIQL